MYSIVVTQFVDEDDQVITTAATEPEALSVSVQTTGAIVDVGASSAELRGLGAERLAELFVGCAQAAFQQRYAALLEG